MVTELLNLTPNNICKFETSATVIELRNYEGFHGRQFYYNYYYYYCFDDDGTLDVSPKTALGIFRRQVSATDYTMETEKNNKLPFLDVLVITDKWSTST